MVPLTFAELDAASAAFDEAVRRTPAIDRFCSSSDWILPARALVPPPAPDEPAREPFIHRGDEGFTAFVRSTGPDGLRFLQPLEAMWGLACPIVGPDPVALVEALAGELRRDARWDVLLVCGVPTDSLLEDALLQLLGARYEARLGEPTARCIASLDGGAEAFLARRSPNFRRSLRRAERDAADAGISFAPFVAASEADAEAAYERVLAVEARSWKGLAGSGITSPEMQAFYRAMVPRLARREALCLSFAQKDGRDVGFILGGLFDDVYRGLQFSFDDEYRDIGLGNVAQWTTIQSLAPAGITIYDLGTDREYKRRWADELMTTQTLAFLHPRLRRRGRAKAVPEDV